MDILVSSNLERMLFYASGCDCDYVAGLMKDLNEKGRFEVTAEVLAKLQEVFDCGYASNEESKQSIAKAFYNDKRLIDPHTACGYKVAEEFEAAGKNSAAMVILSTASPFKFAKDAYEAIFGEISDANADGFVYMSALSEKTGDNIPAPLASLKSKEIRHKDVVDIDQMADFAVSCINK